MPVVSEVCRFLDQMAPKELAEDWDNTGLLVGRADVDVSRILTCLTLTSDVAKEALKQGAQLIVSHHPVLFRGARAISDQTSEGRLLLELIQGAVAVYSAHTRFDSAQYGVNQQLAEGFGLRSVVPIRRSECLPEIGSGRVGRLSGPCLLKDFLDVVREVCQAKYLEYCGEEDAVVEHVAVACGAAAEFLDDAIAVGCDTFVTGEARFHSALAARAAGVNLIVTGHYSSERPAMEWLADKLQASFTGVDVRASINEQDPFRLSH
ncbi:MAG: Nif3-like dinuclear metal center hexameric protein [Fuerstiella sp.]|nr:Nif3-like dinuclear metal center hexameric protein [Fuerstiella sp.]